MRKTYTDIWNKFLRNIQSVGVTTASDPNLKAEFNDQFGSYYQLMLAKLKNYKTYLEYPFLVGMYALDLTSGTAAVAISTITSSGTTATVTTGLAHGYTTSDKVAINNINPKGYTGTYAITVTSTTTFTYTLPVTVNNVAGDHAQYYKNPPGFVTVDGITIAVGQMGTNSIIRYPLTLESSQLSWEKYNIVPMQIAIPPQKYFPRRDDFGIWPIPRTLYQANLFYHYRDRNLLVDDYTAGTLALQQNSNAVVGTATTFTSAMVGRWLEVTDTTVAGQGYFYRIASVVDTTHLTLESLWQGATNASVSLYRIGETPEIPEDLQMYLIDGITGGYLKDIRKDFANGTPYLNSFFTGDPQNSSRKENDENILGGLIGGMKAYADREDQRIVNRGGDNNLDFLRLEPWGIHLSSS